MNNDTETTEIARPNPIVGLAYIRDGESIHTGEAVLLACILHSTGADRSSSDMKDLQRIMRDHNLKD